MLFFFFFFIYHRVSGQGALKKYNFFTKYYLEVIFINDGSILPSALSNIQNETIFIINGTNPINFLISTQITLLYSVSLECDPSIECSISFLDQGSLKIYYDFNVFNMEINIMNLSSEVKEVFLANENSSLTLKNISITFDKLHLGNFVLFFLNKSYINLKNLSLLNCSISFIKIFSFVQSKIVFENIAILNASFNDSFFIESTDSNLLISNINIIDASINFTNFSSKNAFISNKGSIFIDKISVKNAKFSSMNFIKSMHSSLNESTTHIVSGIWKEILLTQNDILIESDTFELIFKKILIESTKSETLFIFGNSKIMLVDVIFQQTFGESNILIKNSEEIKAFNLQCINSGITFNSNIPISQTCLKILNSKKIKIYNVLIVNSFGNSDALGIILYNEKIIPNSYVLIANSSFLSNQLISPIQTKFPGGIIHVSNLGELYISSSYFSKNIYSGESIQIAAVCLTNIFTNLKINSSYFSYNQAIFYSNCIVTYGNYIAVNYCIFSNNVAFGNYSKISETKGRTGCIESLAGTVHIGSSYFVNNSKNLGGALTFFYPLISKVDGIVIITNCIFLNNKAVIGGAIFVSTTSKFNILIKNSVFLKNWAFQNAGSLNLELLSPTAKGIIKNNIFFQNIALNAGVYTAAYLNFLAIFDNYMIKNYCSSITPDQRDAGLNPRLIKGIGLYVTFTKAFSKFAYTFNKNNSYLDNYAASEGTAILNQNGINFITNCYFRNVDGSYGVVIGAFGGKTIILKSIFEYLKNFERVPGINMMFDSFLFLNDTIFRNCSANSKGIILIKESNAVISNCKFIYLDAKYGALIFAFDVRTYFFFVNNEVSFATKEEGTLMNFNFVKQIFLQNVRFTNIYQNLIFSQFSRLMLYNVSVENLIVADLKLACFFYIINTDLKIVFSNISNIQSKSTKLLFSGKNSNFSLDSSFFKNLTTHEKNSFGAFFELSNIRISNTTIIDYDKRLFMFSFCNLTLLNVVFTNNKSIDGTQIDFDIVYEFYTMKIVQSSTLMINSTFEGNTNSTNKKGVPLAVDCLSSQNFIIIYKTIFYRNSGFQGGAIKILNCFKVSLLNSYFEENRGEIGGAIFSNNIGAITISRSTFFNNSAKEGGAIAYFGKRPIIKKLLFVNNSAIYGQNISSYSTDLKLLKRQNDTFIILHNSTKIIKGRPSNKIPIISEILVGFFDFDEELVIKNISSNPIDIQVKIESFPNNTNLSADSLNLKLLGNTKALIQNGMLIYTNITLNLKPLIIDLELNIFITVPNFEPYQLAKLMITGCEPGEVFNKLLNTCVECPLGSYSLSPLDLNCLACPKEAQKCYGSVLEIKSGFWKSSRTQLIYKCFPFADSCLGKMESTCQTGYFGIMCQCCNKTLLYSKNGLECLPCSNTISVIFKMLGPYFIMIILILFGVNSNLKHGLEQKSDSKDLIITALGKIFIHHIQMFSFLRLLNFEWDSNLLNFFSFQAYFGDVSESSSSLECILSSDSFLTPFYLKIYLSVFLPFILIAIAWIWSQKYIYQVRRTNLLIIIMVIIDIIHPSTINVMIESMSCEFFEGSYYLNKDKNFECYTKEHILKCLIITFISLLIWGLIYPIYLFDHLRKNLVSHRKIDFLKKFGFIYRDFQKDFYFWGIIILAYRLIYILCINILSIDLMRQCLVIFLVLGIYGYIQIKNKPYNSNELNKLAIWSHFILIFSLLLKVLNFSTHLSSLNAITNICILIMNIIFYEEILRKLICKQYYKIKSKIFPRNPSHSPIFSEKLRKKESRKIFTKSINTRKKPIKNLK